MDMAEDTGKDFVGKGSSSVNPEWFKRKGGYAGETGTGSSPIVPVEHRREETGVITTGIRLPGETGSGGPGGPGGGGRGGEKGPQEPEFEGLPDDFAVLHLLINKFNLRRDARGAYLEEDLKRFKAAIDKRTGMVRDAEAAGVLDEAKARINAQVETTTWPKRAQWGTIRISYQKLGKELEEEAEDNPNYKREWKGMLQATSVGTAYQVYIAGVRKFVPQGEWANWRVDPDDPQSEAINSNTREGQERIKDKIIRKSIFPVDQAVLGRMEREEEPARAQAAGQSSEDFIQGVAKVLSIAFGEKLTTEAKYREFLATERYANEPRAIGPDDYWYVRLSEREREVIRYRLELERAAHYKRKAGWTMEDLSKNPELSGLSKSETAILYHELGVRGALEIYIELIDKAGDPDATKITRSSGEEISILQCSDRKDVEGFRRVVEERVRTKLYTDLQKGILPKEWKEKIDNARKNAPSPEEADEQVKKIIEDYLMIKPLDAEQIAFNLLYVGNTWEVLDAVWQKGTRTRRPTLKAGEFLNAPIKTAMRPLDALIDQTQKGEEKLTEAGAFGRWAYKQEGGQKFDRVEVIPATRGNVNDFWRVRGSTLNIPECYPIQNLGSIWEETQIGGKKLIDYLRNREEIPWQLPEAQGLWSDYLTLIRAAGVVWDYYQGKARLSLGQFGEGAVWERELLNSMGKLKRRNENEQRRWIFYASLGIKEDSRAPKLQRSDADKDISIRAFGQRGSRYLNNNELLFPWDGVGTRYKIGI
ncbi:hypothetical protein HY008_03190 [Candidatus Woesebacteria bacterium]|nr:hypothetical protein [Candidatus Woesebacteria bacterium]